jgi:hypothetical protein
MRAFAFAAVVIGACACGGTAPSAPPTRCGPVATPAPATTGSSPPAGAIAVPDTHTHPALWLDPTPGPDPLESPVTVAWGNHSIVASAGNPVRRWVVDSTEGVIGPLQLPANTTWVGLGGVGDDVLVALDDGTLLGATNVAALVTDQPKVHLGAVPGATSWASAPGGIVAAGVGGTVRVSTDGGRTFRATIVGAGLQVARLEARYDGVLVAQARSAGDDRLQTFLGRIDGGWRASPHQPYANLVRYGSFIVDKGPCRDSVWGVALAADGRHWMSNVDVPLDPALVDLLSHWERSGVAPPRAYVTASVPPPPPYDAAKDLNDENVGDTGGESCGQGHAGGIRRTPRGVDVLRLVRGFARSPAPSTAGLSILGDGECAPADVVSDNCRDGAPYRRAPHLLAWRDGSLDARVLTAPPGCVPAWAASIGGLRLLRCDAGVQTTLFALDGRGQWASEGALPVAERTIVSADQAEDGTIVLSSCVDDGGCRAFVRGPAPPGDRSAWRALDHGDVFRALPGGAALVLTADAPADGGDVMAGAGPILASIHIDVPGQPRRTLGSGIRIATDVREVAVRDGHVVLELDQTVSAQPPSRP